MIVTRAKEEYSLVQQQQRRQIARIT